MLYCELRIIFPSNSNTKSSKFNYKLQRSLHIWIFTCFPNDEAQFNKSIQMFHLYLIQLIFDVYELRAKNVSNADYDSKRLKNKTNKTDAIENFINLLLSMLFVIRLCLL